MFAVGMAIDENAVSAISDQIDRVKGALRQHDAGTFLNFTEQRVDVATAFPGSTYRRLQQVRAELDPDELFRPNHQIAPAS